MSHFSVLVITDSEQTENDLKRILQPWHEFECTGEDDEYVKDIDKTEEARAEYESDKATVLKAPDGTLHDRFDDKGNWKPEFSRPTKSDHFLDRGRMEEFIPLGYEKVDVPTKTRRTFLDFIDGWYGWQPLFPGENRGDDHKYGYVEVDADGNVVRCIDRTNENAKWDWWQVGGRYSGKLIIKDRSGRHDESRVGDLNFEAMAAYQRSQRRATIDEIIEKSGLSQADVETGIHASRELHEKWMALPEARPRGAEYRIWQREHGRSGELASKVGEACWDVPELKPDQSIDAWVAAAPALTSWAVVKDGKWLEKAEMGWFGMSSGDMPEDEWHAMVTKMVAELPEDSWITVVDCHI